MNYAVSVSYLACLAHPMEIFRWKGYARQETLCALNLKTFSASILVNEAQVNLVAFGVSPQVLVSVTSRTALLHRRRLAAHQQQTGHAIASKAYQAHDPAEIEGSFVLTATFLL